MKHPLLLASAICVGNLFSTMPVSHAQIAPGLRAPATQLDGFEQAHSMACFLASAGRPVAGLNLDAPELMGEGLSVEENAPDWLSDNLSIGPKANITRLTTDSGDVWIIFDRADSSCTMAGQVRDNGKFMTDFVQEAFSSKDWKRKKDKQVKAGFYYRMKLGGLTFNSTFPDTNDSENVFVARLETD